jgi:hypothetical protein
MNETQQDAKDCAQQAFLISLETLQNDKLKAARAYFFFC